MTMKLSNPLYSGIQLAISIALIGGCIASGYETYQGDRCHEAFAALAATNQPRLNNAKARIELVRAREAAFQSRMAELIGKFSGPGNDRK